jgi:translation elongation factor EF-1beta
MSNNQSSSHVRWGFVLAILLGILTYGGLAIATGRLPWSWLNPPESVRIEPYILLYSFLGSVAYLLSSLLSEYKLLSEEERELIAQKKEKLAQIDILLTADENVPEDLEKDLDNLEENLKKFEAHKYHMMEIWIKLARIPFGMVMAAVFYLLAAQLVAPALLEALGDKFLAGGVFVVAFFPKVIMEGLNGLANRLMGKTAADLYKRNRFEEPPPS